MGSIAARHARRVLAHVEQVLAVGILCRPGARPAAGTVAGALGPVPGSPD